MPSTAACRVLVYVIWLLEVSTCACSPPEHVTRVPAARLGLRGVRVRPRDETVRLWRFKKMGGFTHRYLILLNFLLS
jgi:hypothetical protein